MGFDIKNNSNIYDLKNIIRDIKVRSNSVRCNFSCLDAYSRCTLFKSQCLNLYGCQLWDLSDKSIKTIELTWRKCSRSVLRLPYTTHNYLIPYLVESNDILTMIENRILNFVIKGIHHDNELISFFFKNSLMDCRCSYLTKNINKIVKKHNLLYVNIFQNIKVKLKNVINVENDLWKIDLIKEILSLRDDNNFNFLNVDDLNSILIFLCTS